MWPTVEAGWLDGGGVVVCHDWLTARAGSDKVAAEIAATVDAQAVVCFSKADHVVDELGIECPVHESRFGPWASRGRRWQALLPLMPIAWRCLELRGASAVVTSSHATVNAIRADAKRLCYCHTPMRYAWEWRLERHRLHWSLRPLLPVVAAVFRFLDRRWSRRVDVYLANSSYVADRIERAYGRSSVIVHPPIDVAWWRPADCERGDEFLYAGRLIPYKRADLVVRAAMAARRRLVVAGDGPELGRLRTLADDYVRFVVNPDDAELRALYQQSRAFVYAGIEDFGMTLVEAQACGAPVIARNAGGALDSVDPEFSGRLVDGGDVDVWANALRDFTDPADDRRRRAHAETFSSARFAERIRAILDELAGPVR